MDNTTKQDLKAEIKRLKENGSQDYNHIKYLKAEIKELKDDINEGGQKYLELQIKNKKLRDTLEDALKIGTTGLMSPSQRVVRICTLIEAIKDGE